jgi:parallel beta-helix repeat protein
MYAPFVLSAVSFLLVQGNAFAENGCRDDHDIAQSVARHFSWPWGASTGYQGSSPKDCRAPLQTLQCGQTVTTSVTMAADLNCPNITGFALNVIGSNIVVDGGGHKIVAPLAEAGLFAQGSDITLQNFTIQGVTNGDGILAYDSPNILIRNNNASGNKQGIVLYADSGPVAGAQILNNTAAKNSLFGVRTGYDSPGLIVAPLISGNNLSNSGSYGLLAEASQLDLGSAQPNTYAGSLNGIYLTGANANVHDLVLSQDRIQNVSIFGASLQSLTLTNVDVSSVVSPTRAQGRIGVDLYRVASFSVNGLDGSGNDVGVKLETELGANPTGVITRSRFWKNDVSGILLVSYDGTPYGLLNFFRNCFETPSGAVRVLAESGVTYATGSSLDDGLNVCGFGQSQGGSGTCQ